MVGLQSRVRKMMDYVSRMKEIAEKMNRAINAGKIRELRKIGEECHSEALALVRSMDKLPDGKLKNAARQLFLDVRLGSPIHTNFDELHD